MRTVFRAPITSVQMPVQMQPVTFSSGSCLRSSPGLQENASAGSVLRDGAPTHTARARAAGLRLHARAMLSHTRSHNCARQPGRRSR